MLFRPEEVKRETWLTRENYYSETSNASQRTKLFTPQGYQQNGRHVNVSNLPLKGPTYNQYVKPLPSKNHIKAFFKWIYTIVTESKPLS